MAKQESPAYGHRVETGYVPERQPICFTVGSLCLRPMLEHTKDFLTDGYHQNIPVWDYRKATASRISQRSVTDIRVALGGN